MRTLFLVCCFLLIQSGLSAQKEVIVLHVTGQVQYYAQYGAKPVLMYPGLELDLKGKMRCKGSASAKLLYNGGTFVVSGTKFKDIQDVVKASGGASQMSFTGRFFNFVTESVKEGETREKLEKHHRRYMSKTSGGIKGYAKPGYAIIPLLLTIGKLPSANVIFKWRNTPGEGPYTFNLLGSGGQAVAKVLVRDTFITLDLEQLALNLDEEYNWKVTRGDSAKSLPVPFMVCPASTMDKQNEISQEAVFKTATPTEQQLMLAYSLEQESCFYSANQTYAHLLAADPDNLLLRKMYATFLARRDMLPEANAFLSSPRK